MKVFDCFTFFNEFELLELRFMELYDTVDHFVIVEANRSHTGKDKELFLADPERQKYFAPWWDKVIYVPVTDLPMYDKAHIWIPENFQRNAITRGLEGAATVGDSIIVSDLDEIPKPDAIRRGIGYPGWLIFMQDLFYYFVNCQMNCRWNGPIMAKYGTYDKPQDLRNVARGMPTGQLAKPPLSLAGEPDGGWHYSFMGGAAKVKEKVENIAESHEIIEAVGTLEEIEQKIATQKDLWNRVDAYAQKRIVDISTTGPKAVWKFLDKHPQFFFGERPQ